MSVILIKKFCGLIAGLLNILNDNRMIIQYFARQSKVTNPVISTQTQGSPLR